VQLIREHGATPCAVLIALDRMEKSGAVDAAGVSSALSAVQEVEQTYGIPVISIANLDDLFAYLSGPGASQELARFKPAVAAYRAHYGAAG
jgi:orotate phosphoribosyltransferase